MKSIYKNIYLVFCLLSLWSCSDDNIEKTGATQQNTTDIETQYKLLNYTPNIYHQFFKSSDNVLKFSSLKANSFRPNNVVKQTFFNDVTFDRYITVNNQQVETKRGTDNINEMDYSGIYGKTITFNVFDTDNAQMRTDGDNTVEFYVPELVEITNPAVNIEEERYPYCYYGNFLLEWNADPNNEEGLVIIAEYSGFGATPESNTETDILNTDYIENDTGSITLNPSLFENIPNLAYVDIILLRGNIAVEEIEGELYRFVAESHHRLPITLVKDLNSVQLAD